MTFTLGSVTGATMHALWTRLAPVTMLVDSEVPLGGGAAP
jgi:hypothetical protein